MAHGVRQDDLEASAGDIIAHHEVRMAGDALPGQAQVSHYLAAGGRKRGRDLLVQALHRPAIKRRRGEKANQLMIGQLRHRGWPSGPLEIGGARHQIQSRAPQQPGMQGGVRQGTDANGHVGTLLKQVDDAVAGGELQLDTGIATTEFSHQRHQLMQHEGAGSVHSQPPAGLAAPQCQRLFGGDQALEPDAHLLDKATAFIGQGDASRGAV